MEKSKSQIAKKVIESVDGRDYGIFHELAEVMTGQELEEAYVFLKIGRFWEHIDWGSNIGKWHDFLEFCRDNFSEKVKDVIRKM